MRRLFCAWLIALSASAVELPAGNARGQRFVIGISPFLERSMKDEVYRGIVRLMVQDLPLNSSLAIYDAFELKSITQVTLPDNHAFNSAKTRANQFAPAVQELRRFLAADHPKPASKQLHFDGALRLPQFCDFLVGNIRGAGSPLTVLLLGSPLYQDAKEPEFSMADGFFPSDGHLQAPREGSVFGSRSGADPDQPLLVHWIYFGDPWINELHQEKITRFWTLYLERRGGRLATFSGDLRSGLDAFRQGADIKLVAHNRWIVDPAQTKVEMLRVRREIPQTDWLTGGTLSEIADGPPEVMIGPVKIGIRWKANIDLDLYATPRHGAETLFFQHPRSPEGYYYKDHRSSPGREYEFIEFESPIDIRELEAFVNFYHGSCPDGPRGEVRIEFNGRIYGAPFSLSASEGNRGRSGPGQEEFWTRIPVQEILRIAGGSSRGG